MTARQAELPLKYRTDTRVDPEPLIAALTGQGWVLANRLGQFSDRKLRAMAAASNGRIISGQKGYCLTSEATLEEVRHASFWLRSQAHEMTRRALQIDRILHTNPHP